jgi:hypothetical protein
METIEPLLAAVRHQTSMLTSLSATCLAAVLYVGLNTFGIRTELRVQHYRFRGFLYLSIAALATSLILPYVIYSLISGVYFERLTGTEGSTGKPIEDMVQYFSEDYVPLLPVLLFLQMLVALGGLAAFVIWFTLNVWHDRGLNVRHNRGKQHESRCTQHED